MSQTPVTSQARQWARRWTGRYHHTGRWAWRWPGRYRPKARHPGEAKEGLERHHRRHLRQPTTASQAGHRQVPGRRQEGDQEAGTGARERGRGRVDVIIAASTVNVCTWTSPRIQYWSDVTINAVSENGDLVFYTTESFQTSDGDTANPGWLRASWSRPSRGQGSTEVRLWL